MAGYGMNGHPTPGSLFAMGWSRSMSKDLFRFIKSDEKKNYLLMTSILFYFFISSKSIVSNRITFHPPCALHRSRVLSCTSPVAPACFWLVVECNCVVYWAFKPPTYFFPFFCRSIRRPNRRHGPIPHAPPRSPLSFIAP